MSTCICKEVSCPKCGAIKKTQMWPGMNIASNPELREKVLKETLFDWDCPDCGYRMQLVYPCLYHDKSRKLMICVAPNGNTDALKNLEEQFPQLSGIKKRLVLNLAELKEKVLIFEAGLDDVSVELVKFALTEIVRKKHEDKAAFGFFSTADEVSNHIGFSFFFEGAEQPVYQGTRMDVYQKSKEIVSSVHFHESDTEFLWVNSDLAQEMLDEYQQNE